MKMSGEFGLIGQYFGHKQSPRKDVHLDIGDDCAIVKAPENSRIAITTDTIVEGTHFLPNTSAEYVASKLLVSNLSDLAAMGATPAWASLALTLPEANDSWLAEFSKTFFEIADYYNVKLVGGDTTKGPLSATLTLQGFLPVERALTRHGARAGDWIYVTGSLGDSHAGLSLLLDPPASLNSEQALLIDRHFKRVPRILVGQALINIASAAIDISDGLIADLGHVLKASDVGAMLDVNDLPLSPELLRHFHGDREQAAKCALMSGEEYELCFTVPDYNRHAIESTLGHTNTPYTCIGQIRGKQGLELVKAGKSIDWQLSGFDHFA